MQVPSRDARLAGRACCIRALLRLDRRAANQRMTKNPA